MRRPAASTLSARSLGLGAAVVYSTYILSSEGVASRLGPLPLGALVCTGAATTLTIASFAAGDLQPGDVGLAGAGWLACLAAVSTVGAIALFFAGLRRVGPSTASILSTLEPVVTVALAFVVFGESLGPAQLLGGALVLAAVVAVRAPARIVIAPPRLEEEPTGIAEPGRPVSDVRCVPTVAPGSVPFVIIKRRREENAMSDMAPAHVHDRRRWYALALLCVVQFMVVLDIAIVNVALPSIQADLNFSDENLQWVISAYSLVFGGFLLLGGRLADILGRRGVFMAGLVVFSVGSLLCGLAWSDTRSSPPGRCRASALRRSRRRRSRS